MRRFRRPAVVAAFIITAGLLLAPASASADPIDISGGASGLTVDVDVLGVPVVIGPLPVVTTPPGGSQQVLGATVPGVADADVLAATSEPTPTGVESTAQVVGADVLAETVTADVITATCSSTPGGSTGASSLANAEALGVPIDVSPPANTQVPLPLLGSVFLNEQAGSDSPGSSSMTVNAVRVALTGGLTLGGIVISQASCSATEGGVPAGPSLVTSPTGVGGPGGPGGAPPATAVTASPTLTG